MTEKEEHELTGKIIKKMDKEFPKDYNAKWRIACYVYSHYLDGFFPIP